MYNKDYILRMVEMLAELIASIFGLINKGDYEKASESLEDAYQDLLKQDASFFRNLNIENLTQELIQEHNYTNDHLEILAGLFYTEAELLYAKDNKNESKEYFQKSLLLYEFVTKESKSFSLDKQSRIDLIKGKIGEL